MAGDLAKESGGFDLLSLLDSDDEFSMSTEAGAKPSTDDYIAVSAGGPDLTCAAVKRLLYRAARWRRRGEHRVARELFGRAARFTDAPMQFVVRAIFGLYPSQYALGEVATMAQWLEYIMNRDDLPAEARARVLLRSGRLYERHGDFDSAQAWFARAAELSGVSAETASRAQLKLAQGHYRQGDVRDALNELVERVQV